VYNCAYGLSASPGTLSQHATRDAVTPPATPPRPAGEVVRFATCAEFESWLEAHDEENPAIWLMIARRGSAVPSITYDEAIEVALCFGWIDGQKAGHDDQHWLQRFTPRTARSRWSEINRKKAEALIAAGRMRPAGLDQVERAKADGRWDAAYKGQRTASVPDDLQRELDADPVAAAAFAGLDARNRYAIIWRINDAKRAETRQRRIATYLEMLRRGERIHD
jgi:uncharacterized protein YdeI (YjbR/CyaY-like superfamily)